MFSHIIRLSVAELAPIHSTRFPHLLVQRLYLPLGYLCFSFVPSMFSLAHQVFSLQPYLLFNDPYHKSSFFLLSLSLSATHPFLTPISQLPQSQWSLLLLFYTPHSSTILIYKKKIQTSNLTSLCFFPPYFTILSCPLYPEMYFSPHSFISPHTLAFIDVKTTPVKSPVA